MKRSATAGQGDLFGSLPSPAPGTVAIMRIEDWQRLAGRGGTVAIGADQLTPAQRRKLERNSAIEARVLEWLRGAGAPDSYGLDTSRTGDGLVTSTTCEDVAAGIQLTPGLSAASRLVTVGMVLAGNGWGKRYLVAHDRRRKRFYFAPDNWRESPRPPA